MGARLQIACLSLQNPRAEPASGEQRFGTKNKNFKTGSFIMSSLRIRKWDDRPIFLVPACSSREPGPPSNSLLMSPANTVEQCLHLSSPPPVLDSHHTPLHAYTRLGAQVEVRPIVEFGNCARLRGRGEEASSAMNTPIEEAIQLFRENETSFGDIKQDKEKANL